MRMFIDHEQLQFSYQNHKINRPSQAIAIVVKYRFRMNHYALAKSDNPPTGCRSTAADLAHTHLIEEVTVSLHTTDE